MGKSKKKQRKNEKADQKKVENGKGLEEITYVKFRVTFVCSKEECKHMWISNQGWSESECVFCEYCEFKCKVTDVKDEDMELDNYECPQGHRWQSIHDEDTNEQECVECEGVGQKDGSQIRFGRHFWFKCTSSTCGVEWEDHSVTKRPTQMCAAPVRKGGKNKNVIKCGGSGEIKKFERIVYEKRPSWATEGHSESKKGFSTSNGRYPPRFGRHNADFCEMCQNLRKKGYKGDCRRYRKVVCEVDKTKEEENIIKAVKV